MKSLGLGSGSEVLVDLFVDLLTDLTKRLTYKKEGFPPSLFYIFLMCFYAAYVAVIMRHIFKHLTAYVSNCV